MLLAMNLVRTEIGMNLNKNFHSFDLRSSKRFVSPPWTFAGFWIVY